MRGMFYINLVVFISCVICFLLNPIIGAFSLMVLGFIQVVSSLILVTKRDKMSVRSQRLLSIYFLIIFVGFLLAVFASVLPNSLNNYAKYLGFLPLFLALYFIVITHFISKDLKE